MAEERITIPEAEKLSNPKNTIAVVQGHSFTFRKNFGQNFLIDSHVIDKIVAAAEITEEDEVLEIGPGIGTLTQYLAEAAGHVTAVEIDKNLIPILGETLAPYHNIDVVNQDVLKVDFQELFGDKSFKCVANLPYYITTPIIMELLEKKINAKSITVMVQKEVDRLIDEDAEDIYQAIAERYLAIGCSVMTPDTNRYELLERLLDEYQVEGVVEMTLQACHTYNIEAKSIEKRVKEKGLPYIHIETDYSQADVGQLDTRIAAFLEMI